MLVVVISLKQWYSISSAEPEATESTMCIFLPLLMVECGSIDINLLSQIEESKGLCIRPLKAYASPEELKNSISGALGIKLSQ